MTHIAWTEIESFHNIRKYAASHPEILNNKSTVDYLCKVKLHGTNGAVQVHSDGTIVPQSRTGELSVQNDNAGFAKWALFLQESWSKAKAGMIYFGEWCGPGIQKGVACSEVSSKFFAVFAARSLDTNDDSLIVDPAELSDLLGDIPRVYVLPWYNQGLSINWLDNVDVLEGNTALINSWVSAVETEDPWIAKTFSVKGTGEGLVFYPVSQEHLGVKNFNNLTFKAKGEAHKNVSKAAPAQVDAASASSIEEFVNMVLTPARLEQGARGIAGEHKHEENLNCLFCSIPETPFDIKKTGQFVNWIVEDVKKETSDELEKSNLKFEQVQKQLATKARAWYIEMSRKL